MAKSGITAHCGVFVDELTIEEIKQYREEYNAKEDALLHKKIHLRAL